MQQPEPGSGSELGAPCGSLPWHPPTLLRYCRAAGTSILTSIMANMPTINKAIVSHAVHILQHDVANNVGSAEALPDFPHLAPRARCGKASSSTAPLAKYGGSPLGVCSPHAQ